jgi:hypothetical protein
MVQPRRNKHAALKLMGKLLKKYSFVPDRLITDELRSYGVAARKLGIERSHMHYRWKNNRAENSRQPTRRREHEMQGFMSPGGDVRLTWREWWPAQGPGDDLASCELQTPSLSARDCRPCGLAVFSVSAQPAPRRGNAVATRRHGFLRNRPVLGDEIWSRIRQPLETQNAGPTRCLASRRGRCHNQRRETLSLAGGRSGWLCSRRNRPNPPRHKSRHALTGAASEKAGWPSQAHRH